MGGVLQRVRSAAVDLRERAPLPTADPHASTLALSYGHRDARQPVLLQSRALLVGVAALTFIVLANSEGIWWDNPLDRAEVQRWEFAQAFLRAFADD